MTVPLGPGEGAGVGDGEGDGAGDGAGVGDGVGVGAGEGDAGEGVEDGAGAAPGAVAALLSPAPPQPLPAKPVMPSAADWRKSRRARAIRCGSLMGGILVSGRARHETTC